MSIRHKSKKIAMGFVIYVFGVLCVIMVIMALSDNTRVYGNTGVVKAITTLNTNGKQSVITKLESDRRASKKAREPELFPVFIQTQFGWSDARYGYISKKGNVVIEPLFKYASPFSEGLAVAKTQDAESKYGYINKTGKFIIPSKFDDAKPFSEGRAAVLLGNHWGYIDPMGSFIVKPKFSHDKLLGIFGLPEGAGQFSDGLAPVFLDKKWGYIDPAGNLFIEAKFDRADIFSEGLAAVLLNKKWGYIDKTGKLVVKCRFGDADWRVGRFSEGLAAVVLDKKWGFVDQTGNFVIEPKFTSAKAFSTGLAPVQVGQKWGYINANGKFIIQPQFDEAEPFSNGFARVGMESSVSSLETVQGLPWSTTTTIRNLYGYIDSSGKIVIEPKFEHAGHFSSGLAWVHIGQAGKAQIYKEGYVDKTGIYIWSPTNKVEVENSGNDKLLRQLRSDNLREHFEAALSLVEEGKPVIPDVVTLLEDDRWYVQLTAVWILGEIKDESAVEPLIRLLKSEERIGPSGYTSYVGDMSYKPQKELAIYDSPNKFPSWNILLHRRATAIALGKIGDKRAIDPLKEILEKGSFSDGAEANVAVARALKNLLDGFLPEQIEKDLKRWGDSYK